MVEQLADFVTRLSYDDLSVAARQALKTHILDTLGCAIAPSGYHRSSTVLK
jgi:2-methylcitrate dehydratase PrpD